MTMNNVILGVEIECVLNSNVHEDVEAGDYHDGEEVPGLASWYAERDSSIRHCYDFRFNRCVEFEGALCETCAEEVKGGEDV